MPDENLKKCFVIMPIGKEGTEEYDYNIGIYHAIIRPAAEACGYEVKRADLTFETGNIPRQIISDLADADLVIADLSERNANVYFELGIRHVLRRSGTLHVVAEDRALPFDVAQYRAIKYSTHFTKIDPAQKAIQNAIEEKERNPGESDNLVHDTLALPSNYRETSSAELRERVTDLQNEIADLKDENAQLRQTSDSSPQADLDEARAEAAIDAAIDRSIQEIENSPGKLMLQMRELAHTGRHRELLEIIRTALKSPYLERRHIASMAALAQQQQLRSLQNAVLEVGKMRFPSDVDFKRWLAESYVHSSDANLKKKGLDILEQHLGIVWPEDGGTEIQKPFVEQASTSLCIITDHYHETEQYDKELKLLESALKAWPIESRILRNVGRAYRGLGNFEKAEEYYRKAIEADPNDDLALAWFATMLEKLDRLQEAYEMLDRAVQADPEEMDYRLALGVFVIQHGSLDELASGKETSKEERIEAAVQVFEEALQDANNDPRVRIRMAEVLARFDVKAARRFLPTTDELGSQRLPAAAKSRRGLGELAPQQTD